MYTKINERILYSFSVKSSKCGMYFILTSKSQFGLATFQILTSHVASKWLLYQTAKLYILICFWY